MKRVCSLKDKYRLFSESEASMPIFSKAFWLDAVCGKDNWDVCVVEKGGHIFATLPFYSRKKYGKKILCQPSLTQTLGPWIKPSTGQYTKQLTHQKELIGKLISELPEYDAFSQNVFHENTNWLPFYWNGFKQTSRVTYRLKDLSCEEVLWTNLQNNIKREIKKSAKVGVTLKPEPTIEEFIELNRKVFERQGKELPYKENLVKSIYETCSERACIKLLVAVDESGQNHAGALIVWDEQSAYYIMGGGDPSLRNSGATSLCLWEAIKFSSKVTKSFDFEGSMLEPVEKFFRAFGAEQVQYHSIYKSNSKFLDLVNLGKEWVRR